MVASVKNGGQSHATRSVLEHPLLGGLPACCVIFACWCVSIHCLGILIMASRSGVVLNLAFENMRSLTSKKRTATLPRAHRQPLLPISDKSRSCIRHKISIDLVVPRASCWQCDPSLDLLPLALQGQYRRVQIAPPRC
jgi:hypothetical protein